MTPVQLNIAELRSSLIALVRYLQQQYVYLVDQ